MKRALFALALGAVCFVASRASAWVPIDPSEPVWSGTVPFQMNSAGSADLGAATSEMTVQTAFGDWTRVSCTSLQSAYGGQTSARPNTGDGTSVVGWIESGWPYDTSAIGVTQPQWTTGGGGHPRIVEADMELNGVNYTWITSSGRGTQVNAYSIVLHESGHYYGMGHSSDPNATMYYAYSGGIASLNADDQTGICTLYPGSGPPPTDCHTAGCPSGQTCSANGTCVTSMMTGNGGLCSPCTGGSQCTMGACLRYPDNNGYCGTTCSSSAECGANGQCVQVSGLGGECIRLSGGSPSCAGAVSGCHADTDCGSGMRCDTTTGTCVAGSPTGAGLGAPCTQGSDCASSTCFAGACSATCNGLVPTSCGSGFYCNGQATGTCTGQGLCEAGNAGTGAIGSVCHANTDCAGLFCAEGVCTEPCVPGGAASSCPVGYACQVGSTASCGSCQMTGQLGDACSVGNDCASRICVNGACSQTCDPAAMTGCPAMFTCMREGSSGACVSSTGGLGAMCHSSADCLSGQCAAAGSSTFCTRSCGTASPCPRGYTCVATGDGTSHICQPRSGGCGCVVIGARGSVGGIVAMLAVLVGVAARRRRR